MLLVAGDPRVTRWQPAGRLGKRGGFRTLCSTGALGCMLHRNNLSFNLAKINPRVNPRINFRYLPFE